MAYEDTAPLSENLYYLANYPLNIDIRATEVDDGVAFVVACYEPDSPEVFIMEVGSTVEEAMDRAACALDEFIEEGNE